MRATMIGVQPSKDVTWNTCSKENAMLSKFVAPFAGFSFDFAQ
jgi:hypothetical protein